MNDTITFFTLAEGNLLIRLLLAHLISDFVLQTSDMVANKKWLSKYMLAHIAVVFSLTAILGFNLPVAICIAISHWLIDGIKYETGRKTKLSAAGLFITDQLTHIISIIVIWASFSGIWHQLFKAAVVPFSNYKFSLILLGYVFITTPVGYLIKHATQSISTGAAPNENVQHGGKLIGIFERIIILTLVLLGQYEAIGFLITGKSIIRFATSTEHLRSEYVLVGTMMSYAMSILTGVSISWLLSLLTH